MKQHIAQKDLDYLASIKTIATMKKFRIYYEPNPFPDYAKPETHYLGQLQANNFDSFMKELVKLIDKEKNPEWRPISTRIENLKRVIDIKDVAWGTSYGIEYLEQRQDDIFK